MKKINEFFKEIIENRKERQASLIMDIDFFTMQLKKTNEDELRKKLSEEKSKDEKDRNDEFISNLEFEINKINEMKKVINQYGAVLRDTELYLEYLQNDRKNIEKKIKQYFK